MTTPTAAHQQLQTSADSRTPHLLSPIELANYLGVPLATVYRWRSHRGGPTGIRVGRHVRYRFGDVEHWLDELRDQEAT